MRVIVYLLLDKSYSYAGFILSIRFAIKRRFVPLSVVHG